jgi:hypothetical protein
MVPNNLLSPSPEGFDAKPAPFGVAFTGIEIYDKGASTGGLRTVPKKRSGTKAEP